MTLEPQVFTQVPGLETLPWSIAQALAQASRPQTYTAGQILYLAGESAQYVYVLTQGWVKAVHLSSQGREQATLFTHAVDMFGEVAVLTQGTYPCTVTALERVQVWRIPAARFTALLHQQPSLGLYMARRMAQRVRYFVTLVEDLGLCRVETRLARTLLRHAYFQQGRWRVPRRTWTTFDEMAVRLGTVRDVLRRALRRFEDEGLLQVTRKEIVILDPEGLAARGVP